MENLVRSFSWSGRSALVTGHTGFTGGWLVLWLKHMGLDVHGYSLSPPTDPSLFHLADISQMLRSDVRGDVRDADALTSALQDAAPEIVFHLAAQPLVLESYTTPLETLATNVMGTANVLESVREVKSIQAVIVITSDKCYDNISIGKPFQEEDKLGGHDPYSASKACAELITAAYRTSFFSSSDSVRLASARAGNIIGGGDWAPGRLVPDCVRAFLADKPTVLRRPTAVRPWQHVLDAVHGYVQLGEHLMGNTGSDYAAAWNFGPDPRSSAKVSEVAQSIMTYLGGSVIEDDTSSDFHEANVLLLNSSRTHTKLNWRPKWSLDRTIEETAVWYKAWVEKENMAAFTSAQIAKYLGG